VPRARLDDGRLALTEDARLPVTLDGQLALKGGEALDNRTVAVLASNARPHEGGEFGDGAPLRVRPGKLKDRGPLAGNGILPNLADLDRGEVWRTVPVGVRYANDPCRSRSVRQEATGARRRLS